MAPQKSSTATAYLDLGSFEGEAVENRRSLRATHHQELRRTSTCRQVSEPGDPQDDEALGKRLDVFRVLVGLDPVTTPTVVNDKEVAEKREKERVVDSNPVG